MNILKLNSSKLITQLTIPNLEHIKNVREMAITVKRANRPSAVTMSYASYESTQSSTGNRPSPLIVMHGLFGSKGNWNTLCKAMHSRSKPQRKIIAVDARNHGDSPHNKLHSYEDMALDMKEFMMMQKIPKACVMGHSMGGRTMMYFALKNPELVDKLIVVDISPISQSASMQATFSFFELMQSMNISTDIPLSSARQQADTYLSKSITDKGVRAFILTNLVQKNDGSYAWRINIPALMLNYPNIANFPSVETMKYTGNTLFIAGGLSDFIQKTDYNSIKKMFPNAEFRQIEGAGHWLHSEKPNDFLDIVLEFLDKP